MYGCKCIVVDSILDFSLLLVRRHGMVTCVWLLGLFSLLLSVVMVTIQTPKQLIPYEGPPNNSSFLPPKPINSLYSWQIIKSAITMTYHDYLWLVRVAEFHTTEFHLRLPCASRLIGLGLGSGGWWVLIGSASRCGGLTPSKSSFFPGISAILAQSLLDSEERLQDPAALFLPCRTWFWLLIGHGLVSSLFSDSELLGTLKHMQFNAGRRVGRHFHAVIEAFTPAQAFVPWCGLARIISETMSNGGLWASQARSWWSWNPGVQWFHVPWGSMGVHGHDLACAGGFAFYEDGGYGDDAPIYEWNQICSLRLWWEMMVKAPWFRRFFLPATCLEGMVFLYLSPMIWMRDTFDESILSPRWWNWRHLETWRW